MAKARATKRLLRPNRKHRQRLLDHRANLIMRTCDEPRACFKATCRARKTCQRDAWRKAKIEADWTALLAATQPSADKAKFFDLDLGLFKATLHELDMINPERDSEEQMKRAHKLRNIIRQRLGIPTHEIPAAASQSPTTGGHRGSELPRRQPRHHTPTPPRQNRPRQPLARCE